MSTERISLSRCHGENIQLNHTNITCVGQENITITGIIDKNTIGTNVMMKVWDRRQKYTFTLEGIQMVIMFIKLWLFSLSESTCESDISTFSLNGTNLTFSVDPPTCIGWKYYDDLQYEAFVVDVKSQETFKSFTVSKILPIYEVYSLLCSLCEVL